jgi:hypothetical protein
VPNASEDDGVRSVVAEVTVIGFGNQFAVAIWTV